MCKLQDGCCVHYFHLRLMRPTHSKYCFVIESVSFNMSSNEDLNKHYKPETVLSDSCDVLN